jgi:hypothetical protein
MDTLENIVRQFGEVTLFKTEEAAKKLGVVIDQQYLDKCFAIHWAIKAILTDDAAEVWEFNQELFSRAKAATREELSVAFCLNACRGGFLMIKNGEYATALESFGLARSVNGYLLKSDYRKMFSVNGKKGGEARNAAMNRVKNEIINIFREGGNWRSTRQAAKRLVDKAHEIAEKEGTRFTTDDVAGRLYTWFLKDKKM